LNVVSPTASHAERHPVKTLAIALTLAAVGITAVVVGANDGGSGLVAVGVVVILGAVAIGGRGIYRDR
jgi:hypothetical protein